MGNILIEEKGEHHGSINIKYTAFLPYVNSIRLLAIKEGLYETSTCDRMDRLMENMVLARLLHGKKEHFEALLQLRLLSIKEDTYEDSHYLNTRNLSNRQKALLKQIIKEGQKLHKQTINLGKERCSKWHLNRLSNSFGASNINSPQVHRRKDPLYKIKNKWRT